MIEILIRFLGSRIMNNKQWICEPTNNKRQDSESGNALLELTLLSPLLLLLALGAVDFARLFHDSISLANAARAGVQYATVDKAKSGDIEGIIQAALRDAEDLSGVNITAERYCECSGGSAVNCNGNCGFSGGKPRVYVRVTAEKTFETLFPYPGIPHTVALTHEAVMRAQ